MEGTIPRNRTRTQSTVLWRPGSGKTTFAHHLADFLGLNPIVKRGSDLIDSFVGMTEKAIHEAFHEAEGSVLLSMKLTAFFPSARLLPMDGNEVEQMKY